MLHEKRLAVNQLSMSRSSSKRRIQLTKDEEKEVEEAFNVFDVDKSGTMDAKELRDALRALGFDVTKAEVNKIMSRKDPTGNGFLPFEVFKQVCAEYIKTRDPRTEILRAFALFDTDHDGLIDIEDLKKVSKELGDDLPLEELEVMISKFDKDKDGKINIDEFFNIMDPTHAAH